MRRPTDLARQPRACLARYPCAVAHRGAHGSKRCLDQEEEVAMTLTILDPRSGRTVSIQVEDVPAHRPPVVTEVSTRPPSAKRQNSGLRSPQSCNARHA